MYIIFGYRVRRGLPGRLRLGWNRGCRLHSHRHDLHSDSCMREWSSSCLHGSTRTQLAWSSPIPSRSPTAIARARAAQQFRQSLCLPLLFFWILQWGEIHYMTSYMSAKLSIIMHFPLQKPKTIACALMTCRVTGGLAYGNSMSATNMLEARERRMSDTPLNP